MSWKKMKLGDAATFINGYPFKPTDWKTEGKEIIRIQNLTGRGNDINYFDGQIPDKYKVRKGDLLISWSATLGIFEWDREDAWLNQHIFKVVFNKIEFDKSFFKHLISTVLLEFGQKVHGSTMKHITKVNFDKTIISLPPLPEQKRISKILDKADALRQKNKQLLATYDELLQATFLDMFGDPVTNPKGWGKEEANNFIDLLTGYPFKSKDYSSNTGDFKLCGGLIIMPWGIEWDKSNRWRRDKIQGLEKYFLKENDIVMAMDRPWISSGFKIAQIRKEDIPSILVQRTARIRAKKINQIFLYFLYFNRSFEIHARPTETTVPHISPTDIKSYKLIMPPIALQNQFAQIVENIEAQKALVKQSLQESEDLFNGLVQEAFGGEL